MFCCEDLLHKLLTFWHGMGVKCCKLTSTRDEKQHSFSLCGKLMLPHFAKHIYSPIKHIWHIYSLWAVKLIQNKKKLHIFNCLNWFSSLLLLDFGGHLLAFLFGPKHKLYQVTNKANIDASNILPEFAGQWRDAISVYSEAEVDELLGNKANNDGLFFGSCVGSYNKKNKKIN